MQSCSGSSGVGQIKIGFVSRSEGESVQLAGMLIQQIEGEAGVQVLVDEELASRIGRQGCSVRRWSGRG